MTLQEYFKDLPRGAKADMAKAMNISRTWISLIISGRKRCSVTLAIGISHYTKNKVSKKVLRPDIFVV